MIPWVLLTEFKPGCVLIGFIFSTFEVEDLKEVLNVRVYTGAVCFLHLVSRLTQDLHHLAHALCKLTIHLQLRIVNWNMLSALFIKPALHLGTMANVVETTLLSLHLINEELRHH